METNAIAKELLGLERRFWQALKDKDVDTAMRLTDDRCILVSSQGADTFDRKAIAGLVRSAPYTIESFDVSDDVQVRLLDDHTAIVAYKVHEELTVDGKPVSLDAADSSVWVRRDGQWLCALHTESLSGDPFGRDRARPLHDHEPI